MFVNEIFESQLNEEHLMRAYDLDHPDDIGDGYFLSSTLHDDGDSRKVSYELYKKVVDTNDRMTPAYRFVNFLNVSSYSASREDINQAAQALIAKHKATGKVHPNMESVTEAGFGYDDEPNDAYESIIGALTNRIIRQHTDALRDHGPEAVLQAIESVADMHRHAEELGTSDISIMVRQVLQDLGR